MVRTEPGGNVEKYQTYFSGGHYDRRYPRPNPRMLSRATALLPVGGCLLDFGCGSGRYFIPLSERAANALAFDVSPAALELLDERLQQAAGSTHAVLLGPEADDLVEHCQQRGGVDLALCLFGVIAHIETPAARRETLSLLADCLAPQGRLLISVPNRLRRFRAEQRRARDADHIHYVRVLDGARLDMTYRLYDAGSLIAELDGAGYSVERLEAESILPESWVSRSTWLARLDSCLCRCLPARLGYGLLAVARSRPRGRLEEPN